MIDAYTIGITLALNDGVSAGLASIQRDVVALNLAVDKGALQLERFRELGQNVATPLPAELSKTLSGSGESSLAAPVRVHEQAKPAARDQEGNADSISPDRPFEPAPMSFATLADRSGVRQNGYEQSILSGSLFPKVTSGLEKADSPSAGPLAQRPDFTVSAAGPVWGPDTSVPVPASFGHGASQQVTVDPGVAAYSPTGLGENQPGVALAPPPTAVAGRVEIVPMMPQPGAGLTGEDSNYSRTPHPSFREFADKSEANRVSGTDWPRRESRSAAAPNAAASPQLMAWSAAPEAQNGRGADIPAAASVSSESRTSGSSGALYLDGISIGRWMFNQLADQASRPHTGFSGLDPRLTPAFPGAPSDG